MSAFAADFDDSCVFPAHFSLCFHWHSGAKPSLILISRHSTCVAEQTPLPPPLFLYKLLNDFIQIDLLIFVTSPLFGFLLCLLKVGRHVSSVGSLWIRQKSRCRPFLKCTGVSFTVLCQLINKWACAASTRAPRRHWWPTSQRTLCSSWATASVSRSSALCPDCTAAPSWGVFVWQRLSKLSLLLTQIYTGFPTVSHLFPPLP